MHRRCTIAAPLVGTLLVTSATAQPPDREGVVRDRKLGLKLTVSEGWHLTRQTGYPALLVRLSSTRVDGAVVVLSTGALAAEGKTLKDFVTDNNRALAKARKLRVSPPAKATLLGRAGWRVKSETQDGRTQLRQHYVEQRGRALVITLRCPKKSIAKGESALVRLLENIALE